MVAVRQVTISNLSLCDHPPLLISLFPSIYLSFLFLSFSPHNPFPYFYYALPFSVPLIPSFPLALPLIPHPLSSHALESFCIFQGPRELWLDLPLGENKGILFAPFVVLSLSRQINTPATICFSPLLSLSLWSPYFFHPPAWLDWSAIWGRVKRGWWWMGQHRGLLFGIVFITDCLCLCRIRVRPSPIPWLPNGAMPALKVSRLVRLMWYRSVPEPWPVMAVTAAQPTSAPTCKVCYSHTYFITQGYVGIFVA